MTNPPAPPRLHDTAWMPRRAGRTGPPKVRLPFDPIARRLTTEPAGNEARGSRSTPGPHNWYGLKGLARTSGISTNTIHRWKTSGVPVQSADRAARAVGAEHPVDLWGTDYYRACTEYEAQCTTRTVVGAWGCAA